MPFDWAATSRSVIANQVQRTLHWNGYGKLHKSSAHMSPPMNLASGFHTAGWKLVLYWCLPVVD